MINNMMNINNFSVNNANIYLIIHLVKIFFIKEGNPSILKLCFILLITTQKEPNENNIFKVIKALDKIQRTKFNNNTVNHPTLKSQSTIFKS